MYCLSITPKILSSFALLASVSLTASAFEQNTFNQDTVNQDTAPLYDSATMHTHTVALQSNAMQTQTCPQQFYKVELPSNGKLCQVFAADLPASMILFVPKSPSDVISFYSTDSAKYTITRQVKGRYFMQSSDKNTTLIISPDGSGTQVDILVKKYNI